MASGLSLDRQRHVQHLEDTLTGSHGSLHDAVLDGEGADRIEEPLHVEQKGDHDAQVQGVVQHQRAAYHDDDPESRSGQRIDDGHQNLRVLRRSQVGIQVLGRLLVIEIEVDGLPPHPLHGTDRVNAFGQGAIGDGTGLPGPAKGRPCPGQPHQADEEEDGHHRQRQQAEIEVQPQHDGDDAEEQQEVAEGRDGVFQKLLKRVHVPLQPRHHAADFRLVHERQGNVLQVGEHGAAQVEDDLLAGEAHQPVLHEVGGVVHQDHGREDDHGDPQQGGVAARGNHGGNDGVVDGVTDDQRDGQLRAGKEQQSADGGIEAPPVGIDIGQEASYHVPVEGRAEHLLVAADLRAHHGPWWTLPSVPGPRSVPSRMERHESAGPFRRRLRCSSSRGTRHCSSSRLADDQYALADS